MRIEHPPSLAGGERKADVPPPASVGFKQGDALTTRTQRRIDSLLRGDEAALLCVLCAFVVNGRLLTRRLGKVRSSMTRRADSGMMPRHGESPRAAAGGLRPAGRARRREAQEVRRVPADLRQA